MRRYPSEAVLDTARQVLKWQSDALLGASKKLGASFEASVEAILASSGKVVVTGLGKSGHVARKMAATLSSTGSPAAFLHPAEALHGDLGLLRKGDVVVAVAFGGETIEVLEVVRFARRHDIKTIAITGKHVSSLARLADYVLDASIEHEACVLNLAPTSSTTVSMALGDCLAISLMQKRGFAEEDFARYHPGGSLGRRLSLVSDLMRKKEELEFLTLNCGFHKVLEVVTKNNFGLGVVTDDKGLLLGIITDGDLRRALLRSEQKVFSFKASDIMTGNPATVFLDKPCLSALKLMEDRKITSLVVLDEADRVSGVLRMHDLLAAKIV